MKSESEQKVRRSANQVPKSNSSTNKPEKHNQPGHAYNQDPGSCKEKISSNSRYMLENFIHPARSSPPQREQEKYRQY